MLPNNSVGGAEVLQYVKGPTPKSYWIDNRLVTAFMSLGLVKTVIVFILVGMLIYLSIKILGIKGLTKGKGVEKEFQFIDKINRNNKWEITIARWLLLITLVVEHSPFALSKDLIDYYEYNLTRADVRVPLLDRVFRPAEFNAAVKVSGLFGVVISLIVAIGISIPVGFILIIIFIILTSMFPLRIVRMIVASKDREIKKEFLNLYLMLHYTLLNGSKTPVESIMKTYQKTTDSKAMIGFVDICVNYIETYGEYEASSKIASSFRELPEVVKLMRLIKQSNDGGSVENELLGFRNELIKAKQFEIEKKKEVIADKSDRALLIVWVLLFQVFITSMLIYLPDLKMGASLFS